MPTIRELYPEAICNECEWRGPRENMKPGNGVLDELCPECGSEDTEWINVEEIAALTKTDQGAGR